MDENNMNGMEPTGSDGGQAPAASEGTNKKLWVGLLITAIVLSLFSDYIPTPVDDIIDVILSVLAGKNLFGK